MQLHFLHTVNDHRIIEGFALQPADDNTISDKEIMAAAEDLNFKGLVDLHEIVYSDVDTDNDFIRVVPFNQLQSLPTTSPSKYALSTFKGTKIFYGFTFATTNELKDHVATRLALLRHKDTLLADYRDMHSANHKRNLRLLSTYYWPGATKPKTNPLTGKPYNLPKSPDAAAKFLDDLYDKSISGVPDFEYVIDSNTLLKYKRAIMFAFAKLLKTKINHPVSQKFIELATQNFIAKMGKSYDYILYPESGSQFNKVFTAELARSMNIPPAHVLAGFEKLRWADVKINRDELLKRYGKDGVAKAEEEVHNSFKRIAERFPTKIAQIKGINYKERRRYIQLWKLRAGMDLTDKDVLIVDDNVDSSSTMEVIHDLIVAAGPRSVNVYTPLHLSAKPTSGPAGTGSQLSGVA